MNTSQINDHRLGHCLETDPTGRLFDRRLRQMLGKDPITAGSRIAPLEALAALRAAAKGVRLETGRWADRQGLSEGRLQLLLSLRRSPEHRLSIGDLAGMLDVSPRNITGLVDHLEADGLVHRVPDPADRRGVLAELTPSGQEKMAEIWRDALSAQTRLTEEFTLEELAQLRHLCLKLLGRMLPGLGGEEPAVKEEGR